MDTHKEHLNGRDFVRLLTANQSKIYAYVISLVPNFNDANDIMQETTSWMWERMANFRPDSDFLAWGIRIAHFKILDYRKKKRRDQKVVFSDNLLEKIKQEVPAQIRDIPEYTQKLHRCLRKLQSEDRQLIQLKYMIGLTAQEISLRLNHSIRKIYYSLSRIHGVLLNCIEHN